MIIKLWINEEEFTDEIEPATVLLDYLREKGFYSVKRGCDTSNCGLCTVHLAGKPVLSCSTLAIRANGLHITTIEGMQQEASEFGAFLAEEGADQCGFCSPGLVMSVLAMKRELQNPTEDEIKSYLVGNLCRCTGYMGHLRAIKKYMQRSLEV